MPEARHRDAWAEEQQAPSRAAYLAEQESSARAPGARSVEAARAARIVGTSSRSASADPGDDEVLVVVSKLKKYIRDHSGMSTSDGAIAPLSDHIRSLCRDAIRHAAEDGRKTVMDRDFVPFLNPRR